MPMTEFSENQESRNDARHGRGRVLGAITDIHKDRTLVRETVRFFLCGHILVLAIFAFFYLPSEPKLFASFATHASIGAAVFLVFAVINIGLVRDRSSCSEPALGWANKLTFIRFLLVVPIVILIAHDSLIPALVLYVLSGVTDIADGIVARRTRHETKYGVIMDPAADIATTAGLFAAFFARGFIPGWVLIVLIARYASLLVGAAVLHFAIGPLKFKATPAGKIVGVLQAAAGILIIILSQTHEGWCEEFGGVLYPFLCIIF